MIQKDLEFEDETLVERLWGLTEMFPEPIRNITEQVYENTTALSKYVFKWSRSGLWVIASSFTILVLPIIVEQERSSLEEAHTMQSRQLLYGPSAAASSPPSSRIPFGLNPLPN